MKKKLLWCCFIFAALTACKKKDDNKPDNGVVKYLTKIIQEAPDGSTAEITLSYDDKNRLVEYIEKEAGILERSRTFIYDANGRLTKVQNDYPLGGTYEEYTITYTAAGIPEKYVRTISDDDGLQGTIDGSYTISGGRVTRIVERNTDPADPSVYTTDITYTGNNVTKVEVAAPNNTTSGLELTYGSKKNPMHYAMPLQYIVLAEFALEVFSENEITGMKFTLGNAVTMEQAITFQYDAQGYPISSQDREVDGNELRKSTYQYK